jgi:hypothetical protein
MSKNMVQNEGATNDVTIWRIRFACWISKATCTYAHSHAHALGYPHASTHVLPCKHRPIINSLLFHGKSNYIKRKLALLQHPTSKVYVFQVVSFLQSSDRNCLVTRICHVVFHCTNFRNFKLLPLSQTLSLA